MVYGSELDACDVCNEQMLFSCGLLNSVLPGDVITFPMKNCIFRLKSKSIHGICAFSADISNKNRRLKENGFFFCLT